MSIVYNVFLFLDGMIYGVIDYMFDIFDFLAKANLFKNEIYMDIVQRIYIILGLIMMFALSYSLLKAVINPDEFAKGEQSFPKMIKNVIISLAIIAILPTVFNFAFNFQNAILNQDTIPKLILGDSFTGSENKNAGRVFAYNVYAAFLHVNEEYCTKDNENESVFDASDAKTCAEDIKTNKSNAKWYKPWRLLNKSETFYDIDTSIKDGEIAMVNYNNFGEAVAEGKLSYLMLISTLSGLFILIVVVNFCFDMALRVVKLMFFQIIAPIPVVCRVIPGGKTKDVFSTWTKKTISTFVDVFLRIAVFYLGVFIVQLVVDNWSNLDVSAIGWDKALIVQALVIMSIVVFIRQAPKLIGEMFHLDTGGWKIGLGGIADHLKEGGFFGAANAVGSLITSRGNPLAAYRGWKHGMNNANFHNIGGEANRRRAYRDARAQGVTRTEIFKDRMRRMFGFESSNKADDYNIENRVFTVRDQNGNLIELTPDNVKRLETEKFENNTRIAEINSSTSEQRDISTENATVISARGTFKTDGLDEIHKADSEIKEKLDIGYSAADKKNDLDKLLESYQAPGSTITEEEYRRRKAEIENRQEYISKSFVGNYSSLQSQLEKNYKDGLMSDEEYNRAVVSLAGIEKKMQEQFVTAASKEAGQRFYTNYDGTVVQVDDGGKFHTNYQKLVNDLSAGVLRDEQGRTITLDSFVDDNGNQLEGWNLINAVFKRASGINNEIAVDINNSEREKRTIEQANKAIDAIFEQRTKLREQAKNENKYKARKATSEYNDSNAPKK